MTRDQAYLYGFDCGLNGTNKTNSHYTIFSNPEFTRAWELGKMAGEATPLMKPGKAASNKKSKSEK